MTGPALLLFARQPLAGRVKTRLAARLGDRRAAEVAALLVTASVENACTHWPGEVWLVAEPDALVAFTL